MLPILKPSLLAERVASIVPNVAASAANSPNDQFRFSYVQTIC